ncbi:MAG: hypothetical protein AB1641_07065 [Thermodesulfobacteriota bacterium]
MTRLEGPPTTGSGGRRTRRRCTGALGFIKRMMIVKLSYQIVGLTLAGIILAASGHIAHSDVNTLRFSVSIPSADEEARLIWNLLKNIKFYNSNNYKLSLPDSLVVAALIEKANRNELETKDWDLLLADFEKTIYKRADYLKGYEIIANSLTIANDQVRTFIAYNKKWGFHLPRQYSIRLTLYGPGGSYDSKTGNIIILTTKEGMFKRGKNPLETILHEAVHIGIEDPIVKKYGLSHWTKERIVDQFMVHHFMDVCPEYRMQGKAEKDIDAIFNKTDVWDHLPERVAQFVSERKQ